LKGKNLRVSKGKLIAPRENYYMITIPAKWRDNNKLRKADEVCKLFSDLSRGYLLIITNELAEGKLSREEIETDLSYFVDPMLQAFKERDLEIGDFEEEVLTEHSRFSILSLVAHGYSKASLIYGEKYRGSFMKLWEEFKNMENRLKEASSLAQTNAVLRISAYPEKNHLVTLIGDDKEGDPYEYEYSVWTEEMLKIQSKLFSKACSCISNDFDEELFRVSARMEGSLDFLWFYYLRQLKKGIDAGLFSGIELTGIHGVSLSIFSKMLEQNADSLMRILSLFDYLRRMADEDMTQRFKDNLKKFRSLLEGDLNIIKKETESLEDLLPKVLRISLGNDSKEKISEIVDSIASIIATYHGTLVKRVGEIRESYIYQRKSGLGSKEMEEQLFGRYMQIGKDLEQEHHGKGYSFVVSQILSELRRIAKFPRNVAVICIVILTPMIQEILGNESALA